MPGLTDQDVPADFRYACRMLSMEGKEMK